MTIKTVEEFYRELRENQGLSLQFVEDGAVEFVRVEFLELDFDIAGDPEYKEVK